MTPNERALLLVGGPDAGKTNFLARLWLAVRSGRGALSLSELPADIAYVEGAVEHVLGGHFAPRSHADEGAREFRARVASKSGVVAQVLVPDTLGELWSRAVMSREIEASLMELMRRCDGAALFLRINSDQDSAPLDWVTSRALMVDGLESEEQPAGAISPQVFLCELFRFLESTLARGEGGRAPRVSIVITAWDQLDAESAARAPEAFLEEEFPMFAGRIRDSSRVEVKCFGTSVVGGDLKHDEAFRKRFYDQNPNELGFVVGAMPGGVVARSSDMTLPIAWLLGVGGS